MIVESATGALTLPGLGSMPLAPRLQRIVYDALTIAARVRALGAEITAAYPDGDLLVIGLLKGSVIFVADLIRAIERPCIAILTPATS